MGVSTSKLEPGELLTFKKLPPNVNLENIIIPEVPENRKPTNVKWLVILGVVILLLIPFMIYTLYYSDISRLSGYDKCGNICGKKNYYWDGISCSGKDYIGSPYLKYEDQFQYRGGQSEDILKTDFRRDRSCVASCGSGYVAILGRCYKEASMTYTEIESRSTMEAIDSQSYLSNIKWQLIISCLISILVAMGMLFLFRYAAGCVVWSILISCFFAMVILTGVCWYAYSTGNVSINKSDASVFLFLAIFFTICTLVLAFVLAACRRKIHLVILLFKEANKAVFDMPGLVAVPVLCVISILILTGLFAITTTFMSTAGTLHRITQDLYDYEMNSVMIFTLAFNGLVFLWVVQFFTGIQYMVIAGAVSKWYFSRDKNYLGSPILNSVSITFKYHLGSVAFGALLITLIQVIKSIILGVIKNNKLRACVQYCIEAIERFFKFLSKNSYIITAMHGQPFLRSGKRAARLIIQNISDIIAVNYIGDFVLGVVQLLVVLISVLISYGILTIAPGPNGEHNIIAFIIVGVISLLVAFVTFGVFETTIDTLFICYCEDSLLNDGMAKPYFMSRNLMEFIEESKQVYKKK